MIFHSSPHSINDREIANCESCMLDGTESSNRRNQAIAVNLTGLIFIHGTVVKPTPDIVKALRLSREGCESGYVRVNTRGATDYSEVRGARSLIVDRNENRRSRLIMINDQPPARGRRAGLEKDKLPGAAELLRQFAMENTRRHPLHHFARKFNGIRGERGLAPGAKKRERGKRSGRGKKGETSSSARSKINEEEED